MLNIQLEGDKELVAWEEKKIDEIMAKYSAKKLSDEVAIHEWDERCPKYRCREVGIAASPGGRGAANRFEEVVDYCYGLHKELKLTGAIIGSVVDRNRSCSCLLPVHPDDLPQMTAFGFNAKLANYSKTIGGRPLGFGAFFARTWTPPWTGGEVHPGHQEAHRPDDIMNPGSSTAPPALRDQDPARPVQSGHGGYGRGQEDHPHRGGSRRAPGAYAQERANKERDGRHKGH